MEMYTFKYLIKYRTLMYVNDNIRTWIFYACITRNLFKTWEKMLLILLKVIIHPFFIDTILRILMILWKALEN